ncbi:MAG: endonuclease/exonuclease/phosphatase family protein [Pseudomonadota bacterium]
MRVTSYNIRKAVGLDWRRDAWRIVDVLAEIDADVVVLQEADKRLGSREGVLPLDVMETDLGLTLCDVSVRPLSHGWHGNAIFVKPDLQDHSTARIDVPSIDPRGAVSAHFHGPNIEVIGAHLGLTPGTRRRQMGALDEVLKSRTHPVMLAGDFNEWNKRRVQFPNASDIVFPGHSFHASRPVSSLDLFVLSGGVEARSSFVHRSDLARRASDHLPVVIDIAISERRP